MVIQSGNKGLKKTEKGKHWAFVERSKTDPGCFWFNMKCLLLDCVSLPLLILHSVLKCPLFGITFTGVHAFIFSNWGKQQWGLFHFNFGWYIAFFSPSLRHKKGPFMTWIFTERWHDMTEDNVLMWNLTVCPWSWRPPPCFVSTLSLGAYITVMHGSEQRCQTTCVLLFLLLVKSSTVKSPLMFGHKTQLWLKSSHLFDATLV